MSERPWFCLKSHGRFCKGSGGQVSDDLNNWVLALRVDYWVIMGR